MQVLLSGNKSENVSDVVWQRFHIYRRDTYAYLAIYYVGEASQNYDKVEHIPGITKVILDVFVKKFVLGNIPTVKKHDEMINMIVERSIKERKKEKERERWLVKHLNLLTYVQFSHGNIYQAAQDNEEIKTVPRISEVILVENEETIILTIFD